MCSLHVGRLVLPILVMVLIGFLVEMCVAFFLVHADEHMSHHLWLSLLVIHGLSDLCDRSWYMWTWLFWSLFSMLWTHPNGYPSIYITSFVVILLFLDRFLLTFHIFVCFACWKCQALASWMQVTPTLNSEYCWTSHVLHTICVRKLRSAFWKFLYHSSPPEQNAIQAHFSFKSAIF